MWEWINDTLMQFKNCFSREAAFRWFVVTVMGLMLRSDHLGITSIIREMSISPGYYESLLHFFRASSWHIADIRLKWIEIVGKTDLLFCENNKPILVGDGVKQSKEARKMPGVRRLFQESENSAKPAYIFGHLFGAVGVLVGNAEKLFCVPLSMTIQAGDRIIRQWINKDATVFPDDFHRSGAAGESHVVRVIRDACYIASKLKPSMLLLDRYFLTVPALTALADEEQHAGHPLLGIITKAKSNAVAFEKPTRKPGKGRPPLKGPSVKLKDLFQSQASRFTTAQVFMYGEHKSVQYLCVDLLWGKELYRELRFVLVKYGNTDSILACTDTSFTPEQIIRLYSYRFKIEGCFREFKQVIAGFSYRFWSKVTPKLNKYKSAEYADATLDVITDTVIKHRIISAFNAVEGYVMFCCVAMGLVQICSLRFADMINRNPLRWLRVASGSFPSEATTIDFMRKSFFRMFHHNLDLPIVRLINSVQCPMLDSSYLHSA